MARDTGASCRQCRRENLKLFLKGDRCDTPKCALARRKYPPGVHGVSFRGKLSEYGIRLREKQKAKRFYYISEGQFRKYYEMADRMHMSARTFARRFVDEVGVSPHKWLVEQRVLRTRELLETTSLPVEEVAAAVGFGSATLLRHHFSAAVGVSPTTYRRRFAASATD